MDTEYHRLLWKGIEDATAAKGVNPIVYEGGTFNAPEPYEKSRNGVYGLASPARLDGLIVCVPTLTGFVTTKSLPCRCRDSLDPGPLC
jgi:hypothetical protein